MFLKWPVFALAGMVALAGCSSREPAPVEDLSGREDVAGFALSSLKGTRDGDRVGVEAAYGDQSRTLRLHLQFRLTPQAKLESGTWTGLSGDGSVRERSVQFLGGQSGPPSIGGTFDLIGADGQMRYRVTIPLQPLEESL